MMVWVVRRQVVAQSLMRLREQKTHTLFAGYLWLQRRAAELGRLTDLPADFSSFFKRFLEVDHHPVGAPYLKMFTEQTASMTNLWLNENVAGSYAPSSLRPGQPFRRVVNIEGKKYSLYPDHAQLAFVHLLYSKPVQVADLAVVLYRDFGLVGESVSIHDVIDVFAYEFGYASSPDSQRVDHFNLLYSQASTSEFRENWLEPYE